MKNQGTIKKFVYSLIILLILALSNPSKESHQEEISKKYKEQNPISGALGVGYLTSEMVDYKSVGIFSMTKIDRSMTSFGILGMVFITDLNI